MNFKSLRFSILSATCGLHVSLAGAQTADETVELARQAARADRHAEAILGFQKAITVAPERRGEWLLELADQLTWSDRLKDSIALYQEAARTDDPDQERRARRGLARALSWDGKHPAALVEYDRVLAMSPGDHEVRLARAEVLSWDDQQDAALAAYQEVLRDHPDDPVALRAVASIQGWRKAPTRDQTADFAVERARQAARDDRHAESIDGFRKAIKIAPERRHEWLLELADQLTWAGRFKEATVLYQEAARTGDPEQERKARRGLARALSRDGDFSAALAEYDRVLAVAPGDREARLARAETLSWDDQQDAALKAYQEVLRDYPDDPAALRGVGRIQSWRGRHRDAAARMRQFLEKHPHDREAVVILAESYDWMGQPDRAERVLRDQLAADSKDARAASLLDQLEFHQRPVVRIDWRESHQSDDMRSTVITLDSRLHVSEGAGFVGFRYDLGSYVPALGPVEKILVQRPGIQARHRISDLVDWNGGFFVDLIDTDGAPGDHEIFTYDTYFTIRPNDLLRFDVGSSRWTFDNEEALRDGLSAMQGNVSMDLMPNELTKFSGRFSFADYSDGNERTWWQFEMERRIWNDPRIVIGYRYTGFDFSNSWQRGYYSPDLYHSNELLLRANGWLGHGFRWQLRSSFGYEHELPGDSRMIWSAGASLAWEIRRRLEIELAYDYSSSSAASTDGFERGTGRLSLRYTF